MENHSHFGVYIVDLGFGVGSAVYVTQKHHSQQLLQWGWIVSSLHRKNHQEKTTENSKSLL